MIRVIHKPKYETNIAGIAFAKIYSYTECLQKSGTLTYNNISIQKDKEFLKSSHCRKYINVTDVIEHVHISTLNMTNLNAAYKRKMIYATSDHRKSLPRHLRPIRNQASRV